MATITFELREVLANNIFFFFVIHGCGLAHLLSHLTGWTNGLFKPLRVGHAVVDVEQSLEVWVTNEALKKVDVFIPSELLCP